MKYIYVDKNRMIFKHCYAENFSSVLNSYSSFGQSMRNCILVLNVKIKFWVFQFSMSNLLWYEHVGWLLHLKVYQALFTESCSSTVIPI